MDPRIGKVERRGRKTRMGLRPFFETSLSSPFQAILHEWIRELPQIRAEIKSPGRTHTMRAVQTTRRLTPSAEARACRDGVR